MTKKIELDIYSLIGIALIIISSFLFVFYYSAYLNSECVKNPVDYANNYSQDYSWEWVIPINVEIYEYFMPNSNE